MFTSSSNSKALLLLLTLLIPSILFAQNDAKPDKTMHGSFYITWGYNLDAYSKSNIHFKDKTTDDYNFTLYKAKATDRPDFHDLLNTPISVPQYQFNIGYFFNNKQDLGVELSWNHLKYIVTDNQVMHLKGDIRGQHYDLDTLVTPQFVHFEHTNGNNYAMLSLVKRFRLLNSPKKMHRLSVITKLGAGGLVPKTDSYIMGNHNDGPFRLSGYVIGLNGQIRYDFFRYLFLEVGTQGAFANYTDAKVYKDGRAKHTFFSIQGMLSGGINIPLSNK